MGSAPRREFVQGWGRNTGSRSTVEHGDADSWMHLVASAGPRGVIARGAGSGYGDCAQNAGGHVLVADRAIDFTVHPDGAIVTVAAGVVLADLMAALLPLGWTLPVVPGTAYVTVGGAIAADVHGKNHPDMGTFGAQLAGIDLLTPACGEVTVAPDRDRDTFWATVAGLGLTGVILRADLRLQPVGTAWMWCRDTTCPDLATVMAGLQQAHGDGRSAVAWLDGHAGRSGMGRGIVTESWPAATGDLPAGRRSRPLHHPAQRSLPLPTIPGRRGIMRPGTVRAMNAVHLAAARRRRGPRLVTIGAAMHPLDGLRGWPGLYGGGGLLQYQFAVPFGREDVVSRMLERSVAAGCPASLVTLKQFGARNPAPLSFPGPGWTAAFDFPALAAGLPALLDAADSDVAAAGGRVYLVKDSRLRPDVLATMYPQVEAWREIRDRLDPDRRLCSDLSRRLRLVG